MGVKNIRSLHDGIGKCFENDLCELRVCKAWSLQAERPLKDQPIVYPCGCYTLKHHCKPTSLWRARRAPHNESAPSLGGWPRSLRNRLNIVPCGALAQACESVIWHTARRVLHNENGPALGDGL